MQSHILSIESDGYKKFDSLEWKEDFYWQGKPQPGGEATRRNAMLSQQQQPVTHPASGARIAAEHALAFQGNIPPIDCDDWSRQPGKPSPRSHSHVHRKPVPLSHRTERPSTYNSPKRGPIAFLRTRSRRTLIIAAVAFLALLVLIIGLAAGLSHHSASDLPLPSSHGGPYNGDLTYYAPGLGACGITSENGDSIVAVSHLLYDAVQTGTNPNSNPLCGKMLRVQREDGTRSVDLKVVDRCTGCAASDLDVTEDTFAQLADVALGRVLVRWAWLEDVPV